MTTPPVSVYPRPLHARRSLAAKSQALSRALSRALAGPAGRACLAAACALTAAGAAQAQLADEPAAPAALSTDTPVARPAAAPRAAPAAPAAQVAQPSAVSAVSAVTQAAVQKGVLTCAARINQVSGYLGFNAQAGALLMAPPAQPDQRLVPLVLETPTPQGSAYVSAAFAPNQANGCGATYDAVVWWPERCEAVAARAFGNLRSVGRLKKSLTVLDGGPATKVFLMPAGPGCVSIKKEVVL